MAFHRHRPCKVTLTVCPAAPQCHHRCPLVPAETARGFGPRLFLLPVEHQHPHCALEMRKDLGFRSFSETFLSEKGQLLRVTQQTRAYRCIFHSRSPGNSALRHFKKQKWTIFKAFSFKTFKSHKNILCLKTSKCLSIFFQLWQLWPKSSSPKSIQEIILGSPEKWLEGKLGMVGGNVKIQIMNQSIGTHL